MLNVTGGNHLIDVKTILSAANVKERLKVADLGCGSTGFLVFSLSKLLGDSGKVYAVDILKPILETINRKVKLENVKNVHTIWSNLEVFKATKIEAGSLDVVFLVNTLFQSSKKPEILRESVRLLKKGGKAVIVDWKNVSIPFGPPVEERINEDMIKTGYKKNGMEYEGSFEPGDYHYGLIFNKL